MTVAQQMIQLESSDGIMLQVPKDVARLSEFINNALNLEDENDGSSEQQQTVECKRVSSKTLESVVQFLTYHKATPMQAIPDPSKEVIAATYVEVVPQEWYRTYVEALGLDGMWRVRAAADFMGIEPLTYLTNVWLTFHLMDKSIDEMHEILHIPKMTSEQEAQARKDHPWLYICLEEDLPKPEDASAPADGDAELDDEDDDDDDDDEN